MLFKICAFLAVYCSIVYDFIIMKICSDSFSKGMCKIFVNFSNIDAL